MIPGALVGFSLFFKTQFPLAGTKLKTMQAALFWHASWHLKAVAIPVRVIISLRGLSKFEVKQLVSEKWVKQT